MNRLRNHAFLALAALSGLMDAAIVRAQGAAGPKPQELEKTREQVIAEINQLPAILRPPLLSIAKSKDQKRLAKLAIESPDGQHRLIAARVMTDQKLLAKVAGEAKDQFVRVAAAKRLTGADQPSLLKLIETTTDVQVRGTAIHLVKDPKVRAKLNPGATAFANKQAEEEAAKILNSKAGDRLSAIRYAVTPSVLLECAMTETDQQLADEAAKRLIELRKFRKEGIDDTTFEKIALGAKCLYPRRTSLAQVSNKAVLTKLAEDDDDEIRSALTEHLDDQALLAKLARDPKSNVREAAQRRLDALKGKK